MMVPDSLPATIRSHLVTAVLGDVVDAAGLTSQFIPPPLRSVGDGTILVGRAMTVQETDIAADDPGEPSARARHGLSHEADLRQRHVGRTRRRQCLSSPLFTRRISSLLHSSRRVQKRN
jgi:hypothetical protein